ncbi:hypothetical protein, partial [Oenococcus oeni]|uniref:hypothetical protein n=1 Tax=Oenococcus oeni TaxID=1247 RepID=UPI001C5AF434
MDSFLIKFAKSLVHAHLATYRMNASFDWSQFSFAKTENPIQKTHKAIRHYQQEAIDESLAYFKDHDR